MFHLLIVACIIGLAMAAPEKVPSERYGVPDAIKVPHSSAASGDAVITNTINHQEKAFPAAGELTSLVQEQLQQQKTDLTYSNQQGSTSFAGQSSLSTRYIPVQQPQPILSYIAPQPETRFVQPDAQIRYVIVRPETSYTVAPAPQHKTRYSVIQPSGPIISKPRYVVSQPTAPRPSYGSNSLSADEFGNDDAKYKFGYQIKDDYTANFQSRHEQRDGKRVAGTYVVYDPDGFLRTVRYGDDGYGFYATVTREPNSLFGTVGSRAYGSVQGSDQQQQQQQYHKPQQQHQLTLQQYERPQQETQQPQQQFQQPQPLQQNQQQYQPPQQEYQQPQQETQQPQELTQQPQQQFQHPQQQFQQPQQQFQQPHQRPQQEYQQLQILNQQPQVLNQQPQPQNQPPQQLYGQ